MGVGKLDQTLDLGNEKRRPILVDVLYALAHVIAIHNSVRHDARTAHDGPPETLPGICSINSQAVQPMPACASSFAMAVSCVQRRFVHFDLKRACVFGDSHPLDWV
jgi:hypothetical protein